MKYALGKFLDWIASQVVDPIKFRRLNGWAVIIWTVMMPIAIITGLWSVVAFIGFLSIYANWATHLSAWAGARSEAKQVEIAKAQDVKVAEAAKVEVNE